MYAIRMRHAISKMTMIDMLSGMAVLVVFDMNLVLLRIIAE
jgi:hypothetical protein